MTTQVTVRRTNREEAGRECWGNIPEDFVVAQGREDSILMRMVVMAREEKAMAAIDERRLGATDVGFGVR